MKRRTMSYFKKKKQHPKRRRRRRPTIHPRPRNSGVACSRCRSNMKETISGDLLWCPKRDCDARLHNLEGVEYSFGLELRQKHNKRSR